MKRRRHPVTGRRTRESAVRTPDPESRVATAPAVRDARLRARTAWLLAAALGVITVVAYEPVRHNGFVSYDDYVYVTDNAHVKAGITWPAVAWAFTTIKANFWHPLTWLSIELDVQLYGLNAGPHHVSSLLLHIASTLLLFLLLRRATEPPPSAARSLAAAAAERPRRGWLESLASEGGGRSALVAALFAVHPLHVESVAWIAERKDTLSTVFWMLTLWAYVGYVRDRRPWRYALVIVSFALGLMAKPMLVTLPFVLLLLDIWPLGRVRLGLEPVRPGLTPGTHDDHGSGAAERGARRFWPSGRDTAKAWLPLVREKLPLFALAAIAGVIAVIAQQRAGAVADVNAFPLAGRVANALVAVVAYPLKTVWPVRLVPFYPYAQTIPVAAAIACGVALIAATLLVARSASRAPYVVAGWFWYLGTLLPVSGLIQVGSHAMADRYTYVPLVGLFIIVAWGAVDLAGRWRVPRALLPASGALLIVGCVVATRAQVQTWKDTMTLWQHTLDVMPDNYYAHNALGLELDKQGRSTDAMAHFVESIRLAPGFVNARENIGMLLGRQGRTSEAIAQYEQALQLVPHHVRAHINLANELARIGRLDEAIAHYHEALRLDPASSEAHTDLGSALQQAGRLEEAIAEHREAIRLDPDLADAHYNLGNAFERTGRLDEALAEYQQTLRLQPASASAHNNLGAVLQALGRYGEATTHYEQSLRLDPRFAQALGNLGTLLLAGGKPDQAAERLRAALRLDPSDAQLHTNLGTALQQIGRLEDAIGEHREAIRLRPNFADAHYNLANAFLAAGRLEAAATEYRETLRLEGESPEVRNTLNAVLKKLGRH